MVLHKQIGHALQAVYRTLNNHRIVGTGTTDSRGNYQQVRATTSSVKGNFALEIADGGLALAGPVAGEVVIRGKHSTDPRDFDAVVAQNLRVSPALYQDRDRSGCRAAR